MPARALATPASARARCFHLLALFGAAAAVALTDLWSCPFALVTGYPCPGCGMTRAALALARGHVEEAIRLHPLSPLVVPLALFFVGDALVAYLRQQPATLQRWVSRKLGGKVDLLWLAAALLLVGVWVARFLGAFGGAVSVSAWRF